MTGVNFPSRESKNGHESSSSQLRVSHEISRF